MRDDSCIPSLMITVALAAAILALAACATEAEYGQREDAAFFRWLEQTTDADP